MCCDPKRCFTLQQQCPSAETTFCTLLLTWSASLPVAVLFSQCAPTNRWTKELGDKLVAQYQQYLQQQISSGRDLTLLNPEDGTGCEDNFDDYDEEAPYTLGRLQKPQKMLQGNNRPHAHQQQQGMQQGGVSASGSSRNQQQQRPPAARSNSGSFGKGPLGSLGVGTAGSGWHQKEHQKEHHGLVGRSASMTVPHSWQAMTSSLFGVGVVPAAEKGADKAGWGIDG